MISLAERHTFANHRHMAVVIGISQIGDEQMISVRIVLLSRGG
jgi:hypothetical protein